MSVCNEFLVYFTICYGSGFIKLLISDLDDIHMYITIFGYKWTMYMDNIVYIYQNKDKLSIGVTQMEKERAK